MMLCKGRSALRSLVLLSVSATLLLSACSSPDDDNDPTQVSDLTGTITGTIQDTDGHAIAGATIRYAGASESGSALTATTNADGQFSMPGVTVTGISGTTANDANGPITLAIAPPAGYMSATIQASPIAQSTGTVGGGTVFIDDFNVGVGVVKLPALASAVSGTLRSSATGSPVAGASVSLDFVGVEFSQDGTTTGVATTYDSSGLAPVTSGTDGSFAISSVYNDACVRLAVSGYAISGISGAQPPCTTNSTDTTKVNLRTSDASNPLLLATVSVSVPTSGDTVPPVVASVDGVVDASQTPAQLESSVGTVLKLHFSEAMANTGLDASSVFVVLGNAPSQTQAAVSSAALAGNTLTVTLASALPASTRVELHVLRQSLKDAAANGITVSSTDAVAYDSLTSQDLVLSFMSFGATNAVADAATVSQVSMQTVPGDTAYAATDALLDTVNTATSDIRPAQTPGGAAQSYPAAPATMEQLNSLASITPLQALLLALSPSDARVPQPGVARVGISVPGNASDFIVWVQRGSTKLDVLFYPVATAAGNPQNVAYYDSSGPSYQITPGNATSFDLLIRSRVPTDLTLQAGDVFYITSRNASGINGGVSSLKLGDNGRPSVALQPLDVTLLTTVSSATPQTVLLSITPQAADITDGESGYASDNWQGSSELQGLSHQPLQDSSFATDLDGGTSAIGDAYGTDRFLAIAAPLSIALTEPVTATSSAPTTTASGVTLSVATATNNASTEGGTTANLLTTTVDKIFALASSAAGTIIDVSGSIVDLNGTAPDAATRALVEVRDRMPPLLTRASYNGSVVELTFNEAVTKAGNVVFSGAGCGATINLSTSSVTTTDNTTYTWTPPGALSANCFTVATYAEDAYGTGAALLPHGAVSYTTVQDMAGNSWQAWDALGLGITTPSFAIANTTPAP